MNINFYTITCYLAYQFSLVILHNVLLFGSYHLLGYQFSLVILHNVSLVENASTYTMHEYQTQV